MAPPLTDRFLREPEVEVKSGLSRTTRYQLRKQGKFPQTVKLGARAVGTLESALDKWIQERAAASTETDKSAPAMSASNAGSHAPHPSRAVSTNGGRQSKPKELVMQRDAGGTK